jgi:signal peptidase I
MSPIVLFAILVVLGVARAVIWVAPTTVPNEKQRSVVKEYLDAFIIAGVVALVLMHFVVRTFWIPSGSMEPTLDIHDVLLANEIQYRFQDPKDEQIAVFEPPADLGTTDFIKRVMAAPGDNIRIHNGSVYRNGKLVNEPYIPSSHRPDYELEIKNYDIVVDGVPLDPSRAIIPPRSAWQTPDRIPKGYYLMLGDNRNDSNDGHLWGLLPRDHFVGHAFLVFWPITHFKILH